MSLLRVCLRGFLLFPWCCGKHCNLKLLRRGKGLLGLQSTVCHEEKSGQNLRQELKVETGVENMEEWLAPMLKFRYSFYTSQDHLPKNRTAHNGIILLTSVICSFHQEMPYRLAYRTTICRHTLNRGFLFPRDSISG